MPDVKTSLQVPREFLTRADRVKRLLVKVPDFQAIGSITRSKVLRLAIARGLQSLEAEFGSEGRR